MRVLGIDYGTARMGLAQSDPSGVFAFPLGVENVASMEERLRAVIRACEETGAECVVVGLPLRMGGNDGPMTQEVRRFAERLKLKLKVPVVLHDERMSSQSAERVLLEADLSRQRRKGLRDKVAAQIILQAYLDGRCCRDAAEASRLTEAGQSEKPSNLVQETEEPGLL